MRTPANLVCLPVVCVLLAAALLSTGLTHAQQVVIDEHSTDRKVAGDFYCSPCYNPLLSAEQSLDIASKTLTTGELYRYFQSRGITSLNRFSLQIDVDCDPLNSESCSLTELSFQIRDSAEKLVTHAELGETELLLDRSEITSFKPEAVLEFDLGYDFMERFSPDSTDSVVMNFETASADSTFNPRIVVSQEMTSFSFSNTFRITLFVVFWAIIFFGVYLITQPSHQQRPSKRTSAGGSNAVDRTSPVAQ